MDVVEVLRQRIVDVNGYDFPVGLSLVNHGKDAKDLDLEDGASRMDGGANLTDVDGVVVTLAVGGGVGVVWVLPGLGDGPVVPDVAMVGETVGNKSEI